MAAKKREEDRFSRLFALKLRPGMYEQVNRLAERSGCSINEVIRTAIAQYITGEGDTSREDS